MQHEAVMARVAVMGAAAIVFLVMEITGNHICAAFIYALTVAIPWQSQFLSW